MLSDETHGYNLNLDARCLLSLARVRSGESVSVPAGCIAFDYFALISKGVGCFQYPCFFLVSYGFALIANGSALIACVEPIDFTSTTLS